MCKSPRTAIGERLPRQIAMIDFLQRQVLHLEALREEVAEAERRAKIRRREDCSLSREETGSPAQRNRSVPGSRGRSTARASWSPVPGIQNGEPLADDCRLILGVVRHRFGDDRTKPSRVRRLQAAPPSALSTGHACLHRAPEAAAGRLASVGVIGLVQQHQGEGDEDGSQ